MLTAMQASSVPDSRSPPPPNAALPAEPAPPPSSRAAGRDPPASPVPSPSPTPPSPNPLRPMTRREYANYERDFDALTGEAAPRSVRILTGAASVPALKATGAPKHVLRHAWVLADADRDGNLTFDEFTVAMYLCERAAEGCELPQTLDAYAPGEFPPREEDETAQSSSDAARIVDVPATVRSRERDRERNATPGTPPGTLGERSCLVVSPTTKPPAPPARASYPNATKQTPFKRTSPGSTTEPRVARTAAEAAAEAEEARRRRRTDREPDFDRLKALHEDADARRFHRDDASSRARARRIAEEDAACTFEPALNAYSRGIVRSPAQTLEARATAIVVGRETRREMRRDLARLEAEESFGGVGHARVDPDALAAKIARWEHDRVEREFRLERARDAKAAEETNGGFRPTLSSTPRAVALRDRVASADRRPWRARLGDASTRRAERADAKIPSRRRTIRTEAERDRVARAMHAEAATRDARRDADRRDEARETARRAPKLAAADAERLARASRVATIRAVRSPRLFATVRISRGTRWDPRFATRGCSPPRRRRREARFETRRSRCIDCARVSARARVTFAPFTRGSSRDSRVPSRAPRRIACARSRRDGTRRRSRSNGPGAGPISVASSTSGDGRASRRRRGGPRGTPPSARRRVGPRRPRRPWPLNSQRAKLSRTPIGRDRNRRRTPDGDDACGDDACGDDACGDDACGDDACGDDACGDDAFSDSAPGNPLNLAARRLGFERAELASNAPASNAPASNSPASNALNAPSPHSPSSLPGSVYRPPPSPMRRAPRLAVADRLAPKRALTERAIAERRAAKEAEEAKECTFRPKITRGYRSKSANATSTRAYASASEKYPTREQREAAELAECTFKPKINKPPRVRPRAETEPEPPRASEPKTSEPKASDASERRAPNSKASDASRRSAGKVSNAATGRWSGPPPWEPRNAKGGQPPPTPTPARPRSAAPPGYDETVRRMRAAKEARETRGETSVLDSRAAWIDPRGAADGKKKKAEAKAAKTRAKLADAAKRNIAETRRASSSARASTPRDGTESVSGAPRSPTIEKETEPNGDETADDDGSARATESKRLDAASGDFGDSAPSLSASSFVSAPSHSPSPSVVSRANRSALPSRASSRRPPPLDIEVSFGSSADFGVRLRARSPRDVDSPGGLPSTPPSANRRAASTRTPGSAPGSPVFSVPGSPVLSVPGSPVLSASATLDIEGRARRSRPSRDRRDVDAPRRRLQCLRTDFRTPNLNPGR